MQATKLILLFISIVTFNVMSVAQPITTQTYEQMLEVAAEAEASGDYYNALEWYDKAYDERKDKNLLLKVVTMLTKIRDFERAESWLGRILDRDKENEYADQRYNYGLILKALGKYEEAITQFNIFMSESENPDMVKKAKFELDGIGTLNSLEPNLDVGVRFGGSDLNSASAEASPRKYRDGNLYFSSYNRKTRIDLKEESGDDYHSKILYSTKGDKGYGKPEALGEEVNRQGFHNANVAFTKDGRVMYFTRAQLTGSDLTESFIYVSYSKDEGWSPAVQLEGINGDFISKHPAPGELYGKDVLFFVSDMDGGYGGFDIYYATDNGDGTFAAPVNLGEGINTAGDEITPFYQEGVLYFSSNGLLNIGGFDIFKTEWDGSNWSDALNMGFGYNSSFDDMYLSFSEDEKEGYFVSNRPDENKRRLQSKTCCDDIYLVNIREIIIDLLATITDKDGNQLDGATVVLKNLSVPNEISPESKTLPNNNLFQFSLDSDYEYIAVAKKEGFKADSVKFNTAGLLDNFTVKRTISLEEIPKDPVTTAPEEPEYETITTNQVIRLNNIYYDFDDTKILQDAEKDLQVLYDLMIKYPTMIIELSSHTDAQGLTKYNEDLSQRRAESATNWLLNKGIAKERINPKGYGESVILNHCKNGVRCDDDEHRLNRRTEFKIIDGPKTIEIKTSVLKGNRASDYQGGKQSFFDPMQGKKKPVPVITFDEGMVDLGTVKRGDTRDLEYEFTNTGKADLLIEIVTACKCTKLDWPKEVIKPGERGVLKVTYDSTTQKLGEVVKTVDIISNTDPLVVEARFKVNVVE